MNRALSDLYHPIIQQHEREPFHYWKMTDADLTIEAYNPLCGDRFTLFLKIKDGRIQEASFHGYGCAISKASTSVLTKKIQGLPWTLVQEQCQAFYTFVMPEQLPSGLDAEFEAFAAAKQFPERRTCATLSWDALFEHSTQGA